MNKSDTEMVADSPRSKRAKSGLFVFGFLPALAVAFVVFAIGLIARPPEYVARATFVVDWNEMASVLGDDTAEKVRALWRKKIVATTTASPGADELSGMLDPKEKLSDDDRAALISQVQRQLHVTLTHQAGDQDSFVIEFRAHDAAQAEAVANHVLHEKVSDINSEAVVGRMVAAARSEKNLDDINEQRERGDSDSSGLDLQELQARLSLIGNGVGMLLTPAKVVEKVHVENSIGRDVGHALFTSVFFGGMAGLGGLGLRKIVSTRKTPKAASASAVPPKLPSMNVPPVIARFEIPKPPVLPRA